MRGGKLGLFVGVLLAVGAALTMVSFPTKSSSAAAYQPQFPVRAAFYYGWFPQAWDQSNIKPFTRYNPSLGWYDVGDLATAKKHVDAMLYGNIQVGIETWWGQGHFTDANMATLLQAASGTDFRWAVYYENESTGDPSVAQIRSDLTYLRDKWSNDPSYYKIDGKFVVFVYADGNDACGMADRWKQANTVGAYVVLKVFGGYTNCASQPNNWHQYGPAVAADSQGSHSYTISPGFDFVMESGPRLTRDLTRWNKNIRDMVASGADFQLITTFNEWGEGTSVESATQWSTSSGYGAYLDALHNNGQTGAAAPPAAPVSTATATATKTSTPRAPTATRTATARLGSATRTATKTPTKTATKTPTKTATSSTRSTAATATKTATKSAATPTKTATKAAQTTAATPTPTPWWYFFFR